MTYTLAESGIASLVIRCNNIINGEYTAGKEAREYKGSG